MKCKVLALIKEENYEEVVAFTQTISNADDFLYERLFALYR